MPEPIWRLRTREMAFRRVRGGAGLGVGEGEGEGGRRVVDSSEVGSFAFWGWEGLMDGVSCGWYM